MVCMAISCSPEEACKVLNGLRGCYPATRATCHVYGDPHYLTFDGRLHHFQGACNYTLVQTCNNHSASPFSITARNEHRGSPTWTALNSVTITLKGLHIALRKGKAVYINGVLAKPVSTRLPDATIEYIGSYVRVTTNIGVQIQFDGDQDLLIDITENHQGKVCGLCGTYTGDPQDDFSTPAGVIVEDVNVFGNSWRVPDDQWKCNSTVAVPEPCSPSEQQAAAAQCQALLAKDGPFSSCHSAIPPQPYFDSCIHDLCATGGSSAQFCNVLWSYAAACRAAGIALGDWEVETSCESCFFNCTFDKDFCEWQQSTEDDFDWSHMEHCVQNGSDGIKSPCNSSGNYYIYADSSFTHMGEMGQLVSPECTAHGPSCFRFWYRMEGASEEESLRVYLVQEEEREPLLVWQMAGSKGETWLQAELDLHISGRFQILLEGVTGPGNHARLAVDDISLDPGCCLGETPTPEEPTASGETPTPEEPTASGCVTAGQGTPPEPQSTLSHGTSPSLEAAPSSRCKVAENENVVVPVDGDFAQALSKSLGGGDSNGRATCSASGDPHYTTFDGLVHHFMGNCTYTLSQVCTNSSSLPGTFHVSTTNEHRGSNTAVSYVKSVHVEVYGKRISLLKNWNVEVNTRRSNLPIFIGNNKIVVQRSGSYVFLETDFGLGVRFDGNHYVEVSVPPLYKEQLCGLCGNYNGDPLDDNLKPDGQPAGSSTLLGDSWLVPENLTGCSSPSPLCKPELESEIRRDSACTMITDPAANFFENCVLDTCFTNGQQTSLCNGLQAYAEACSNVGLCLEWRNATLCPISCPAGSHYESCGHRCSSSCVSPSVLSSCSPLPVGGCFCDEGFVLSGDRCVLESSCGCVTHQGQYYQAGSSLGQDGLGESWFSDETCSERCTCEHGGAIECMPWECGVLEKCSVQDGVLGCHTSSRASCHVVGDPHYYTFDKVMHTFVGTCSYTLVAVCSNNSSVTPITVIGRNEDRGQRGATYLREVYVDVYGTRVTLQKNKRILFNNERAYVPMERRSRANSVVVGNVGIYLVVETDFGLVVKYDGNQHLEISLPGTYFSQVCGLCGNYNGLQEDELLMPDGAQAKNVTQFGNSWKVDGDSDASPFTPCHHLVRPELFIQTCMYDMCKYDGMLSTLCAIVGESWVTRHCSQKCRCRSGGVIKCQSFGCEVGEICQLKNNGKYSCKPTGFGKCLITGDPHYLSFDGLLHHFQGKHTYMVSQSQPDAPQRLEPFSIEGKNKALAKDSKITFLKELKVIVYNHTVLLRQGKKLVVDGVKTVPPAQPHEGLRVQQRATRIYLETDFGLSVSFDGAENSDIMLPNTYKKKVEGLCGNFDGKHKNDFTTPDGVLVKDVNTFGESWRVPVQRGNTRLRREIISEEELDSIELDAGFTLHCTPDQLSQANSSSNCGILADPKGPFQACFDHITPSSFLTVCLFDMCMEANRTTRLCPILEQYALACQAEGVTMDSWREKAACAPQCPPNSKYSACMSTCPASCSDLAAPAECSAPCLEGCECLSGYVLSGFDCVAFRECGCSFLGRYYQVGESFMTDDCSQVCVCTNSSSISCSRATCTSGEQCTVANFTRGCYTKSMHEIPPQKEPTQQLSSESSSTCPTLPLNRTKINPHP
ncbi:hypothetical protein JD844_007762 [Phrynosoma platyrhinos]|uniref:Zonadhesin n=1 Tax=Phrynosoma platyrhinos TaxID=52577 RepID=A0ABQ7T3J9_PHRPL|nr:hypothetical protein JD844_007762 [Phrynosoma platyrhinos]